MLHVLRPSVRDIPYASQPVWLKARFRSATILGLGYLLFPFYTIYSVSRLASASFESSVTVAMSC
jgi:hypothetical protein